MATLNACLPQTALALTPCLSTLSRSQLVALQVALLAENLGYTMPSGLTTLLTNSACHVNTSDKQKLQSEVAILVAMSRTPQATMTTLIGKIKCLQNANPKQIEAALAFLTCQLYRAELVNQ